MSSIRVSSDPFGRSIKKTLEHLQQKHANSNFGYSDMPPLDDDYLAGFFRDLRGIFHWRT